MKENLPKILPSYMSKELDDEFYLEADQLLNSELMEVEGGASGCSTCQYICYTSLW